MGSVPSQPWPPRLRPRSWCGVRDRLEGVRSSALAHLQPLRFYRSPHCHTHPDHSLGRNAVLGLADDTEQGGARSCLETQRSSSDDERFPQSYVKHCGLERLIEPSGVPRRSHWERARAQRVDPRLSRSPAPRWTSFDTVPQGIIPLVHGGVALPRSPILAAVRPRLYRTPYDRRTPCASWRTDADSTHGAPGRSSGRFLPGAAFVAP